MFPGSSPVGMSVVSNQDSQANAEAFLAFQQQLASYWSPDARTESEVLDHGAFCAPTDETRARLFLDHPCYRAYALCHDGEARAFLDGFVERMVDFDEPDSEFHEGGERFMSRLNETPYSFGRVAYLYYLLKENMTTSPEGLYALHDRFVADMRGLGLNCIVTDLPIKIAGHDFTSAPRITQIAKSVGYRPMAKWVDDVEGNVWQQFVYVLTGRPITVYDRIRAAGLEADQLGRSQLWKQICVVCKISTAKSKEMLTSAMTSGNSICALLKAVVGIAA